MLTCAVLPVTRVPPRTPASWTVLPCSLALYCLPQLHCTASHDRVALLWPTALDWLHATALFMAAAHCLFTLPLCPAAQAEAGVLKGMRDQLRCCVATIGNAAAADAKLYSNLYGTIIIWLGKQLAGMGLCRKSLMASSGM